MYGDVELNKEECINHVAKRLGTELGKLASSGKKAGSINRGYGKLTQATIVKLTAYYRKAASAVPNNLGDMRKAVWATFDNATSTDENRSPMSTDSW